MDGSSPDYGWRALTLAQLDFWEEFLRHPDTPVSTVAHAIEISGPVDAQALERAIRVTIAETDVMALRFHQPDPTSNPVQRSQADWQPDLRLIDLGAEIAPREAAMALMLQDVNAPLDLLSQPIAAQWLIRISDRELIWYNRGHHIVLDGYAMGLVETRCAALYQAFVDDQTPPPALGRLNDFLTEEAEYRLGPRHAASADFWQATLAGHSDLPILQKGAENYPIAALEFAHDLTPLVPRILQMAASLRCGWPDLLTALCAAWLQFPRGDGVDGSLVWLPFMSRLGSVSISVPAMVVNILPVPVTIDPGAPLAEALTRTLSQLKACRRHGRYRIEQMAADRGMKQTERFFFSPLINIVPFDEPAFSGCSTRRQVLSNGPGDGFNITIRSDAEGRRMSLFVEADPSLTPPAAFDLHRHGLPAFLRDCLAEGAQAMTLQHLAQTANASP